MQYDPNLKMPGPEEWPDDKPLVPPEGTPIIRPFKQLMRFWPNDQWDRDDVAWVDQYERKYLAPLGENIAKIFRVDLINDAEYLSIPEDARVGQLSCVLTRSQIQEMRSGVFEWYPICVVVSGTIIAGVQVNLDRSNQQIEIPKALLWSKAQQEYIPVFDQVTGKIENPAVLLQIFDRYMQLEFAQA